MLFPEELGEISAEFLFNVFPNSLQQTFIRIIAKLCKNKRGVEWLIRASLLPLPPLYALPPLFFSNKIHLQPILLEMGKAVTLLLRIKITQITPALGILRDQF